MTDKLVNFPDRRRVASPFGLHRPLLLVVRAIALSAEIQLLRYIGVPRHPDYVQHRLFKDTFIAAQSVTRSALQRPPDLLRKDIIGDGGHYEYYPRACPTQLTRLRARPACSHAPTGASCDSSGIVGWNVLLPRSPLGAPRARAFAAIFLTFWACDRLNAAPETFDRCATGSQ